MHCSKFEFTLQHQNVTEQKLYCSLCYQLEKEILFVSHCMPRFTDYFSTSSFFFCSFVCFPVSFLPRNLVTFFSWMQNTFGLTYAAFFYRHILFSCTNSELIRFFLLLTESVHREIWLETKLVLHVVMVKLVSTASHTRVRFVSVIGFIFIICSA